MSVAAAQLSRNSAARSAAIRPNAAESSWEPIRSCLRTSSSIAPLIPRGAVYYPNTKYLNDVLTFTPEVRDRYLQLFEGGAYKTA
jgi:hypothetical protein